MRFELDPRRTMRFEIHPRLEEQAAIARRAFPPILRKRRLTVGNQTYIAYEANSLLEITGAVRSRPGHFLG